jgi:hypothetical protein
MCVCVCCNVDVLYCGDLTSCRDRSLTKDGNGCLMNSLCRVILVGVMAFSYDQIHLYNPMYSSAVSIELKDS